MTIGQRLEAIYDRSEAAWDSPRVNRGFATFIVVSFLATLALAEIGRVGLVPIIELPNNHFAAIYLAFTLLLVAEILSLVFTLPDSVANSVGKQFELLSLILLRKAFLEFSELGEPLDWDGITPRLLEILADGTGALLIYVLVTLFFRVQRHRPITAGEEEQVDFIRAKKVVSLGVLVAFAVLAIDDTIRAFSGDSYPFFEAFYLVLIFADVLLVLISYRYSHSYHVVFRNSGFALSAVMIRLSLSAPAYINAGLGVFAVLFALGIAHAYGRFFRDGEEERPEPPGPGHSSDPGTIPDR